MEEGGFLPENILKRGLTFYEALYWARESGGTKFFYGDRGVDMEIFCLKN